MPNFRQEIELLQNYPKHKTFTFTTSGSSATSSNMFIPENEGYSDSGIYVATNLSIIRAASTNARIRGIAWGR
jgi:hypothetical protein